MPTFIILGKFTQKGVENIKDSPKRLANATKMTESLGGKVKAFYYTMGQYDFVAVSEGLNLKNVMKALMILGSVGSVRTETLVAFPAEEGTKIIKDLP